MIEVVVDDELDVEEERDEAANLGWVVNEYGTVGGIVIIDVT